MENPDLPMPRLRTNLAIIPGDNLGMTSSCISCINFDEYGTKPKLGNNNIPETCLRFGARPPARIIAFGCKDYIDNEEVPF